MKLKKRYEPATIHGEVTETHDFGVEMNEKLFSVLTDQLYQDKIGSIVRELCSNAYDAHVEAGTQDKPFTVHIPNDLEPWFSVKDRGVGMTKDDILEVYTRLFKSTKEDTNDQTGAFGLGSKTPFSYVSGFSVESVKNGKKVVASCYKNDGAPRVTFVAEMDTDEPNGVEVKVPVYEMSDCTPFQKACRFYLSTYTVKPEMINLGDFQLEDVEYIDDKVAKTESSLYRGCIIYGNVPYDISKSIIWESVKYSHRKILNEKNYIPIIPIGELTVTPSRESLEDTEENRISVAENIERIISEMAYPETVNLQTELDVLLNGEDPEWKKLLKSVDLVKEHYKKGVMSHFLEPEEVVKWYADYIVREIPAAKHMFKFLSRAVRSNSFCGYVDNLLKKSGVDVLFFKRYINKKVSSNYRDFSVQSLSPDLSEPLTFTVPFGKQKWSYGVENDCAYGIGRKITFLLITKENIKSAVFNHRESNSRWNVLKVKPEDLEKTKKILAKNGIDYIDGEADRYKVKKRVGGVQKYMTASTCPEDESYRTTSFQEFLEDFPAEDTFVAPRGPGRDLLLLRNQQISAATLMWTIYCYNSFSPKTFKDKAIVFIPAKDYKKLLKEGYSSIDSVMDTIEGDDKFINEVWFDLLVSEMNTNIIQKIRGVSRRTDKKVFRDVGLDLSGLDKLFKYRDRMEKEYRKNDHKMKMCCEYLWREGFINPYKETLNKFCEHLDYLIETYHQVVQHDPLLDIIINHTDYSVTDKMLSKAVQQYVKLKNGETPNVKAS